MPATETLEDLETSLKDIVKRAGLGEYMSPDLHYGTPIKKNEIVSQYNAVKDGFSKLYRIITGEEFEPFELMIYTIIFDAFDFPWDCDLTEEDIAHRNKIYSEIEMGVLRGLKTLEDALTSSGIPSSRVQKHRECMNRVAVSFLINTHNYLFYGHGRNFDPESTRLPVLREFYEALGKDYEGSLHGMLQIHLEHLNRRFWGSMTELGHTMNAIFGEGTIEERLAKAQSHIDKIHELLEDA